MNAIIDAAFERTRTIVLAFVMIVVLGAIAYTTIPKEAEPDIQIPIIYVSMTYEGISPEDSERLLVRPMEKELQSIEGIKEMRSVAAEGYGSVTLEFDAGFDSNKALEDVREKVDIARAELPLETDEPRVNEVNIALFPVITIGLSGNVPERTLVRIARDLRDKIEGLAGVLDVDIGGDREELLEIVVDPMVLETYNISFADISNTVARNNRLVAAGALESVAGRLVLKVPGVLEEVQDIFNLPVKVVDNTVVKFSDVASIRRTFKDPQGFARVGGNPALALEVKKRLGANIVETIQDVRAVVAEEKISWPAGIEVSYMQDKSKQIRNMLADLQNNVFAAIALVMIVIVAAIGVRPAILVGLAIPGSFLAGILVISWIGLTLNIVVLFSLILVVGMLVDGAIVTTELADRKMLEGKDRKQAYAEAAKRMAWPIIASTATTLAVFLPLIFWPGIVGEFMKFLPVTVLATLAASLAMALIFIPVLGGIIGYADKNNSQLLKAVHAAEDGDLDKIGGAAGIYLKTLKGLLAHPAKVLGVAVTLLIGTYVAFGAFGRGVEFFPDVDQDIGQVQVRARGDLSVTEMDAIVRTVEARLLGVPYFDAVYARTVGSGAGPSQREMAEDVIGIVQFELKNWRTRPPASEVLKEVRTRTANIPGVILEVRKQKAGPSAGKPLEILVTSRDPKEMSGVVERIRSQMDQIGGFVDAVDSRPLPGIEWRVRVDRERAARHGADVSVVGQVVSMLTNGVFVAEYRPDDADEEVEIRLRMPLEKRNLEQLNRLRVATTKGQVPIGNFVRFEPSQKTSQLKRTDGRRVLEIKADVSDGLLVDEQVRKLKAAVANMNIDPSVNVRFKGQDADQREASNFLIMAFFIAIFSMVAILVTQFNSFYQTALVLSAIVFSTAGVMIGLLATNQPFGIVMCGIGIIALAGIVVNNNIVLIDTYNDLRSRGMPAEEAVLRTAAQRVRPVLLTSITTVLGLLPMVFAISIDIIGQDVSIGAPSTQWWTQLSSSIAGGLAFATVLTLLLTPCLLILGDNISVWWHGRAGRRAKRQSRAGRPQAAE
jgi:multidrug efflux pump